jgi:aminoglycoside phosphotransferase family enzyme/predicted kinase
VDTKCATAASLELPSEAWGNLDAQVHETHTGVVVLIGDKAYKAKKPIVTDFLDFSTEDRRERACDHEVTLNRRLAPDSYLGVAHFTDAASGAVEPVIVMRRYPDATRLSSMVKGGEPVRQHLCAIAELLAHFHADAKRSHVIDTHASVGAVAARWQENLKELARYRNVVGRESVREVARLVSQFGRGRDALFARRIADRRIVDGHGDLLTDDIFCVPQGPALLDCLEFDDHLRYVDGIDDAAFLAMDLEFLGRKELADHFLGEYCRRAGDTAPQALKDFYIAYRAVVRAKVDCIRVTQGHEDAAADARRHIDIALEHLRAGTVQLVVVGGGPGSGKSTLARALAQRLGAQVISTDDVRKELQQAGVLTGEAGELNTGLYTPENISTVYDEVLRRAEVMLRDGSSVILDGTWRDSHQRKRARLLADQTASPLVEFTCSVSIEDASARIRGRGASTSDATPEIAAALADTASFDGHHIDTGQPLTASVDEAARICSLAV